MSEQEIDRSLLGAYALGVLDPGARHSVEAHLNMCAGCRHELAELAAVERALRTVPPEAFIEGPPPGGELLLQRTLRRMRAERTGPGVGRRIAVAAGVVALAGALVGGGAVVGRMTAPQPAAQQAPPPDLTTTQPPAGTRTLAAADPATGARMTVAVMPAAGWVRVHADVVGIPAGTKCRIWVVSDDGRREAAGSWLASANGKAGTPVDALALIDPEHVAAVEVNTTDGKKLLVARS
jgi:predicted anti-sigma-YlaC factor YlaD